VGEPEEVPGVEEVEAPVPHVPVVSPLEEAALEEAAVEAAVAPPPALERAEAPPDEERLTGLREHLRVHRRDHAERLTLARELWRAGIYDESLDAYSRLLRSKKLVEDVLADLEDYRALQPTAVAVQLVLGDAYMRLGRLDDALEIYRGALEGL
jgi:cytochrome c-type biogenesis protein CcmH/NrfG